MGTTGGYVSEKECADYLKKKNLQMFLSEVRKKYETYGRFTGRVRVQQQECSDLSGILGISVTPGTPVSVIRFVEALQKTKFGCVDMKKLLEAYFEEPVVTKEERRQKQQEQQEQHFGHLGVISIAPQQDQQVRKNVTGHNSNAPPIR